MATKSINKVILIGHLGQDPELRYTGSGTPVCTLRIATNEGYKDNEGNFVERTEWHSVVAWARLAEICSEYLSKGSQVYFEGSLQTRSWEDREGNTRYSTEIKAREMIMLGGRGGGNSGYGSPSSGGMEQQRQPQPQAQSTNGNGGVDSAGAASSGSSGGSSGGSSSGGGSFDVDDDLPF